jgi:transposase
VPLAARFHLVQNAHQVLHRLLEHHSSRLREATRSVNELHAIQAALEGEPSAQNLAASEPPGAIAPTTRSLPKLLSFAAGLRRDEAAVRAALRLLHSNGQVEGQICKLRLLKRSMYGQTRFDLLKHRLLAA